MELATVNNAIELAANVGKVIQLGQAFIKSGLLPANIKTPEAAMAIMIKGSELGLLPMQSFDFIDNIAGRPTLKPQGMLSLIYASPKFESFQVLESTEKLCKVSMRRKGQPEHIEIFTWQQASQMQTTEYINNQKKNIPLTEKYNWKQMPATMLKWRCISAAARLVFPDVIQGMYLTEELDADVKDVEFTVVSDAEALEVLDVERPKDFAKRLHERIGAIIPNADHKAFVSSIVKREIESFNDIKDSEVNGIIEAAEAIAKKRPEYAWKTEEEAFKWAIDTYGNLLSVDEEKIIYGVVQGMGLTKPETFKEFAKQLKEAVAEPKAA